MEPHTRGRCPRAGGVRLWIDECLSPALVALARRRYEATRNQYRELLHAEDVALYAVISDEEWVLVTNNEADFPALTERGEPWQAAGKRPAVLFQRLPYGFC
jgi:predicted nuclease of predicted toxin-antitoxin system